MNYWQRIDISSRSIKTWNIMNIYTRNTNSKFLFLWIIFLLLLCGATYFIIKGNLVMALLILGLMIIAGITRIHGLNISSEGILISRYQIFGFKESSFIIPKADFKEIFFWEHGDLNNTGSTNTILDILFIPALFLAGRKGMTFKLLNPQSNTRFLKIYLHNVEYDLIKSLIR